MQMHEHMHASKNIQKYRYARQHTLFFCTQQRREPSSSLPCHAVMQDYEEAAIVDHPLFESVQTQMARGIAQYFLKQYLA